MSRWVNVSLVVGIVLTVTGALALAGAAVFAWTGATAFHAGDQQTAGWGKLGCVVCLGIAAPTLGLGVLLAVAGVIARRASRYLATRRG